ncbi:MAG: SpoIID/LytB domain-containing protein [Acidaminococcaceae bacterium]|nr:SpoIID/LytB domain-containing protein [Acidaminococcaceae bacterium]
MLKFIAFLLIMCVNIMVYAENIRVSLVHNQESVQIENENEFIVEDLHTGKIQEMPAGKYFLNVRGSFLYLNDQKVGDKIKISRKDNGSMPTVNQRRYNGDLIARARTGFVYLNNEIDLEFFVASVLPHKSSPIWPDEAIKAQAVAARSYAKYMKILNADKTYDIDANDEELPFVGLGDEKIVITKMVQATVGQYLLDKDGIPVMAVTTSSSGGRTESAVNAFGVAYSYLQSVEDFDKDSPDFNWTYDVNPSMVRNLLEESGGVILGKLKNIYLSPLNTPGNDRTDTGRVKTIMIQGEDGIGRVDVNLLVRQLDLKSTLFDIETGIPMPDKVVAPITNYYGIEIGRKELPINWGEERPHTWQGLNKSGHVLKGTKDERVTFRGRGKGHGVGLSVWGARGLVLAKKYTYEQILAHYYPNTQLVK